MGRWNRFQKAAYASVEARRKKKQAIQEPEIIGPFRNGSLETKLNNLALAIKELKEAL